MTTQPKQPIEPRGLRREAAASYLGISTRQFTRWIDRGWMPRPKVIDGVTVWDRQLLDAYFEALPEKAGQELDSAGRPKEGPNT